VSHRIEIHFSPPELRREAEDLKADVLDQWAHELASVALVPTTAGGGLDVVVDGERVFSGAVDAGAPDRAEIMSAIGARLGPPPGEGA
jgi:predicted Rdx family selenoprotein